MNAAIPVADRRVVCISQTHQVYFDPDTLKIFVGRDQGVSLGNLPKSSAKPGIPSCSSDVPERLLDRRRPQLSRLTIHVSNSCNLGCSYCYASGGDYGMGRKLMKSDDAIKYLSEAFEVFDVDTLMFFGGEPSLNTTVIIDCCLFVQELHRRGIIGSMPEFVVISNLAGTGPGFDRFLGVCKQFNIAITVSIDGPAAIHDANRPTLKGHGSFSRVKANFFRARELGIPLHIECTYAAGHIGQGISVADLMKFFHTEFGVDDPHIAPASSSPASSFDQPDLPAMIEAYCDAIKFEVESRTSSTPLSFSIGTTLIDALIDREPIAHYCPAANSELTIGPEGELYPCFMFVGHESFKLGRIQEGDEWLSSDGKAVIDAVHANGKDQHPICRECWARNLCNGCIGSDYLDTKSLSRKPHCTFVMSTIAETVVRLSESAQGLPSGTYGNEHRTNYLQPHRQQEEEHVGL